ncbi:MAG: hypothetical protein KDA81_11900 [Planctomycetaceae bacterium]|nr:hypothetical protein [Planctomycetaceae bacterium]
MKHRAAIFMLLSLTTGCQGIMHELQPHRLWRLNYQEPAGRTDGVYFSVSDPLDSPVPTEATREESAPSSARTPAAP